MDNPNSERPERRTDFCYPWTEQIQFWHCCSKWSSQSWRRAIQIRARPVYFQPRIYGVGFTIRNDLILAELPMGINDNLMTHRIHLIKNQHVPTISAYAPTLDDENEIKDFYSKHDNTLYSTPNEEDFNARVGEDHRLWNGAIGKEGVGKINANRTLFFPTWWSLTSTLQALALE